jgi:hypothetical protein
LEKRPAPRRKLYEQRVRRDVEIKTERKEDEQDVG